MKYLTRRTILTVIAVLIATAIFAKAQCAIPRCPLDGSPMMLEQTYYDGIHQSQRWGHTNTVTNEHHSFVYQCN